MFIAFWQFTICEGKSGLKARPWKQELRKNMDKNCLLPSYPCLAQFAFLYLLGPPASEWRNL